MNSRNPGKITPEEERANKLYYECAQMSPGYYEMKHEDVLKAKLRAMPKPPPRVRTHVEKRMDAIEELLDD